MTTQEPTRAELEQRVAEAKFAAREILRPRLPQYLRTVHAGKLDAYGAACQALGEQIGREAVAERVTELEGLMRQISVQAGVYADGPFMAGIKKSQAAVERGERGKTLAEIEASR